MMKVRLFFCCIVLFLIKCSPSGPQKEIEKDQFSFTQPSKLYFTNIRSVNYSQTTQKGTKVDLYTFKKIADTDSRPILYPVIADNWLEDKAYILLKTNNFKDGFHEPLSIIWEENGVMKKDSLGIPNFEEQLRMAEQINKLLSKDMEVFTLDQSDQQVPIFEQSLDKSNFMIIMRDYLKLVERI